MFKLSLGLGINARVQITSITSNSLLTEEGGAMLTEEGGLIISED